MKTSRILVAGMCCPSEEPLVKKQLKQLETIDAVRFDHISKHIEVDHSLEDAEAIVQALNQVGLRASLVEERRRVAPLRWITWGIGIPLALALTSEAVAWRMGETAPAVRIVAALAILGAGFEPWKRAAQALVRGQLGIHVLMALAVSGALALSQWPEAAMVLTLFAWSEQLEAYSLRRVQLELEDLLEKAPEIAEVQRNGEWSKVPSAQVAVGERVRVGPGDRVPVDGEVASGHSSLDQAAITGESVPVDKGPGDEVFAGTLNGAGVLEVRVTQGAGERQVDRIVRAVQRAQQEKAPIQRNIDQFARFYTPLILLVALGLALVPWLLHREDAAQWLYRALVLLVIACPCALVLATPVTLVSGLAWAARKGILVKGAAALEEAARIRSVAFDKTGTLTQGKPRLGPCLWLAGEPAELLRTAASLQDPSRHPLALAVVHGFREQQGDRPLHPVEGWRQLFGRGVSGKIDGQEWRLVSHRQVEEEQLCGEELHGTLDTWEGEGRTTAVLLCERQPRAVLSFTDPLRPETPAALEKLRSLGIETLMLTGDHHQIASRLAAELNIQRFFANQLPDEKLARMEEELRRSGHVAMVGDGVNDAPTLARASLGIAMGEGGTATAVEVGQVVLMHDDLTRVPGLLELARVVQQRLRTNIALALGSKVAFLILALAGRATLWMAVLADVGACLVVVANGLRLLRGKV